MDKEFDIAIVGMSCRFPGASGIEAFWRNLAAGVESITRLSNEEMLQAGVPPTHLDNPNYVKAAPILEEPGQFDAAFFGYVPMEARVLDPQHRILLELAYEALEDAGCDPDRHGGRIGVFAGSAMNTYFMNGGLSGRFAEDYIPTLIGNDKDFLSTRISYKLNLRGPSITVQTACSTSMVAVHLARQSLLSEESDVALVGAISVRVPERAGYFYDSGGVVSPDGHVRAFDVGANGTVFGSGGAMIVMKRLADAVADGDTIHAVIKGSAVNNDGSGKAGYTAPSVDGQADAVLEALANAGVAADTIGYIEAHGSGTPVGDPIEILALTKAFRTSTQRRGFCAVGSVKTNLGHLDAAAGLAGLLKAVLALKHGQIPPSLNFSSPNPEIDFVNSPFYVNTQLTEWSSRQPRRAGVMSTGMGGTNAHVVLEEAPAAATSVDAEDPQLLVLSAKSTGALDRMARNLADSLTSSPPARSFLQSPPLADVAYTLQVGRKGYAHRAFVVGSTREEAVAALVQEKPAKLATSVVDDSTRHPIVFLLPGVGDQYVGMGYGLYKRFEVFRQEVDRCAHLLEPHVGIDIREILYPKGRDWKAMDQPPGINLKRMLGRSEDAPRDPAAEKLGQTLFAQPALFTVEYALSRLWQHWGVHPAALIGHSMGEYVAACVAGVLSLEDALRLIAVRAQLVNQLPLGSMLGVMLPEESLLPLLNPDCSISLINGPNLCVVAGPISAMADLEAELNRREIIYRPVKNSHAFHSRMMDPIVAAFRQEVSKVRLSPPKIPFTSNVTGQWIRAEEATDPAYWARHANHPARFNDALRQLWSFELPVPLEIGPGRTLGVLANQHRTKPKAAKPVLSSLRHDYENLSDPAVILNAVGRLWLEGASIDWQALTPRKDRRRIPLPTYPFERQRHWFNRKHEGQLTKPPSSVLAPRPDVADWFYVPSWERTSFCIRTAVESSWQGTQWLIISDPGELPMKLRATLEHQGANVALAFFGEAYAQRSPRVYEIGATRADDYVQLLDALKPGLGPSLNIVHLGGLSHRVNSDPAAYDERAQELGFHSLLNLAKAIGELNISIPVRLGVVTSQLHEVTGDEQLHPAMAAILGPCGVIPKEYPNITSFSVDLPALPPAGHATDDWGLQLLTEFHSPEPGAVLAHRGKYRWDRIYRPYPITAVNGTTEAESLRAQGLRLRGVYLITGGTGGIGLAIAKYLAEVCQARLVLTKKSPFPPKSQWRELLASGETSDDARIIKELLEIEPLGAEIEVFCCDASDKMAMQRVVSETIARHGAIHGAIHAAGIIGVGLIQIKAKAAADQVLSPKVSGSHLFYELLNDKGLDFLALFSSLASVTLPYAHVDYCAAHAYMDAFAWFCHAQARVPVIAINWPMWREVGILAEMKAQTGVEGWRAEALDRAILTSDALEVFKRALTLRVPQIVVSPESLIQVLQTPVAPLDIPKIAAASRRSVAGAADVIDLKSSITGPQDEVEQAVADIWSRVLGVAPIGIHERFVDLGGHSLLAMQIVGQIRSSYQIGYTLRNFFEGPTIAQVSRVIREMVTAEIEGLSDQQVSEQLSSSPPVSVSATSS